MFSMHNFVFETIVGMIGKEPEYKVRQYCLGWLEKNILSEDDLAAVESRFAEITAQQTAEEETPAAEE